MKIAIARGRVFKEAITLLNKAGIELRDSVEDTRKLILPTNYDDLEIIVTRSLDVLTYVDYGTAGLGIVGRDLLMEYTGNNIYELQDLNISCCRMMVAAKPDYRPSNSQRIRVATKYLLSARRHFAKKAQQIEIIKLYGSMELAPLVDISDMIVDLVDTGKTLKENNLVEVEEVATISARLVANKAMMKVQHATMRKIADLIAENVG